MLKTPIRDDLLYPNETYRIMGVLFDVWNQIGWGHRERVYQNACAVAFKKALIPFKKEVHIPVFYRGEKISHSLSDFLLFDCIILEIKVRSFFRLGDIRQCYRYLKESNMKLAIIAHFTKDGVKFKRIVNIPNN